MITTLGILVALLLVWNCSDGEPSTSSGGSGGIGGSAGSADGSVGTEGFGGTGGTGKIGGEGGADGNSGTGGSGGSGMTYGIVGQSCEGAGSDCNDKGTPVSCCEAKLVKGGTFPMGRCGNSGAGCSDEYDGQTDETPEHSATVADFYLDTFEVTVGRFRKFVQVYDGTPPAAGDGAHPLIAGSGWQSEWNSSLPANQATLISNLKGDLLFMSDWTWTDTAGANEQHPINWVSWYQAFAFCIWDGGRLPTEAEWEYAAAGGKENRLYPWGPESPTGRANYGLDSLPFINVGAYPNGAGLFGQHDLAGSMWEWVFDWYGAYSSGNQTNPSGPSSGQYRVMRGGGWGYSGTAWVRAATRDRITPGRGDVDWGFRCARGAR